MILLEFLRCPCSKEDLEPSERDDVVMKLRQALGADGS